MKRPLFNRSTIALLLIGVGLLCLFFFGGRSLRAYQQFRYSRQHDWEQGVASMRAIAPWMTIRYVAVAYAVPEEYIFAELSIPYDRRNRNDTLGELNRTYHFGLDADGELAILGQVKAAIEAYRADPVATGLRDIRPWMTIRYIANSSGVPEEYLLAQLTLTAAPNPAVRPLAQLAESSNYPGGLPELIRTLQEALENYDEGGP